MAIESLSEQYTAELRVFGYRMFGSLRETERLVEQTLWQAHVELKDEARRDSVRGLVYKIAGRICLDALAKRPRRTLPALSRPPADPSKPPSPKRSTSIWLEPFPDDLHPELTYENAARYSPRESISLPFIAALQSVPLRERVVVVLCDTLRWQVDSVAEALRTSKCEVNRALDRGRTVMERQYSAELGTREPPADENGAILSMRYLYAWETANLDDLTDMLSEGATLQIPPSPSWYQGREAVRGHIASFPLGGSARGRWRLLPRRANGQLAFGVYKRDDAGQMYRAHSFQIITFEGDLVSDIISFVNRSLFPAFKLRPQVIAQGRIVSGKTSEHQDNDKSFI